MVRLPVTGSTALDDSLAVRPSAPWRCSRIAKNYWRFCDGDQSISDEDQRALV
jgi:hypothetical protein